MGEIKDWLRDYALDVINGDVVACQKHKWAAMRFLKDLEREKTEEFPYYFDDDAALKFIEWAQTFKHTKGVLAGQYIELSEIQIFIFAQLYGWKKMLNDYRRFTHLYWQVARKNAKSQSLALVGSYELMALGEPMSEVYIGATKTEQAKIVWNEVEKQINGNEYLKDKVKTAYGKIEHIKSGSIMAALSKDAGKNGDGLNVQCGILDELHSHATMEIYDVLDSGTGARPQPLIAAITTAGFDLSKPCYTVEYDLISKILNPDNPIENDQYLIMVNELDEGDDITNPDVWEKANPVLCSYDEGREYIAGQLKNAQNAPEKMRNFLTKNMNVWVNMRPNGYIDLAKWAKCETEMIDLEGLTAFVGVDLSKKIDLTSAYFIFPLENNKYFLYGHSFIPENTAFEKEQTDNVPYKLWAQQGFITFTPGDVVDYDFILQWILNQIKKFNIDVREVCYDPYNATQFAIECEKAGLTTVEIRQGMRTLAEPTKEFRDQVYSGQILHAYDPVLTWAVGNAITKLDAQENMMLDKSKAKQRIDPIAATITGFVRACLVDSMPDINAHILEDDFSL